jgi:SAM-dependent methyltransferase
VERPAPINYDDIAHAYEKHRPESEEIARGLTAIAQLNAGATVLDVGCGTGSAAVAFQKLTGATVWGVDKSGEMLRYARQKSSSLMYVRADAHALPFGDGKFDFAYAVLVMHHLEDVPGMLRELYRVLRRGRVALVTCSHEWIRRHPMNQFFPSFASIDLARFPSIAAVQEWLQDAGFRQIETRSVQTEPYPADSDYVNKVADKWLSTLQLLPDDEFQEGLERLRHLVSTGTLKIHWEGVLLTAAKNL